MYITSAGGALCGFTYTVPNKATAGGHPVDYLQPHSEVQCNVHIICYVLW